MSRDDELDDEVAAHLRMAIEERMARGESRASAEAAARREFGNVTHVKEVTREMRAGLWLERLVQDVRYGGRALRRTPAFTIAAVLTLALGIGVNTAVFTVVNGVLLQPLPFREPDRLFLVSHLPTELPMQMSPGVFDGLWVEYRDRTSMFERVAAYQRARVTLSGAGDAVRLVGARVNAEFFSVLGVGPAIGRSFHRSDEVQGNNRVVMLGNQLWRDRFGADPRVVGTSIALDGIPYVVLGVMPEAFNYPERSQLWMPLTVTLNPSFFLSVLGRLADGATPEQAKAELESIAASLPPPPDPRAAKLHHVAKILPLKDVLTGDVEKSLYVFAGAVAFVLLIACANVANLWLIRAATRRREMAVRVALGAGRGRIARQLLTESALVGMIGGAVGMVAAFAGVRALLAVAPEGRIPRLDEVHVDGWVLAFTATLSILTALAFGLVPALASARRAPNEALSDSARMVSGSHGRMRAALVVAEIGLALVLLTGAGLMIKSFLRMRSVDKGYDGARVVTMAVDLPRTKYSDTSRLRAFHTELLGRLSRIPGVTNVGAVSFRPMGSVGVMGDFTIEGAGAAVLPSKLNVDKAAVSPGYFAAMGVRLARGRDFSPADDARAPGAVIVSESIARLFWPNGDAIGQRISMSDQPAPDDWLTVVGVASDVVQDASMTKRSTLYQSYLQTPRRFMMEQMTFVVRSNIAVASVAPAMRSALRDMDPAVPAQALQTMDESMLEVVAEPLFQTRLLTAFSLLALLLAAIGTYGVLAYDVAERSREIGLRMALGATPGDVMLMVMRRTAMLAFAGAAVGVLGALMVTGVLTKSLFEVTASDPTTLASVAATIVSVALLAGYVPARRATRVQALTVLPRD